MSKYFILLIFSFSITWTNAQNCLPGGINFNYQSEIDNFPINYPGCTIIEGDVCIGDCFKETEPSDIKNLDGLAQLSHVLGNLNIVGNDSLTDLGGLTNLTVVEGEVVISYNAMLESLAGFDQIRQIKGGFSIYNNPGLASLSGFELLDTIVGILGVYGMDITSITAFSNLRHLGGLIIGSNDNLPVISDMIHLEYLGGVIIEGNYNLIDLPEFPLLNTIHGDFRIKDNFNLTRFTGYENIERINGDCHLETGGLEHFRGPAPKQIIGFHNLTYVGGDFRIPYVDKLDTVDAFTRLDTIGKDFYIDFLGAVQNFPQPNHFKFIGGDIHMHGIANLENLECFNDLDSLHGGLSLRFCPKIVSLEGIDQVTQIGGSLYLSLPGLPDLSALSNVNRIDGSIDIDGCHLFTDLSGLEGVTSIDGELWIFGNQHLESLEGIHNIDPQSIRPAGNFAINFINNPRLSVCNIENICNALRIYRKSYRIYGNATGCKSINEIECLEFGLSGYVFFDEDHNKIFDATETGVPGINIRIEPENQLLPSNENGRFLYIAQEGTQHTMRIEQGSNWLLTTDSLQYTRVFNSGSPTNKDNNFGIFPAFDWLELPVSLTSDQTRCNQYVRFYLHYGNESTVTINGRIVMTYDPTASFFNSIMPADTHDMVNHRLVWNIDTMHVFRYEDVVVTFKMPNESATGEHINFTVQSFIDSSGIEIGKDLFTYSPLVRCSFDPNDKIVMPPGIKQQNYTLKEDPLTYTVRFENLGNAEAIDVTVFDTLDAALDMSTFKVISSSYPVLTSIDGHAVRFFFMNIWLGKNKKGFVTYEIRPLNDVADVTPVQNHADIVFDLNQPVITNTTLSTLVEGFCESISVEIDTVICRGEEFLGHTETGIYLDTTQYGSYCDSFTQINLLVREANILTQFLDVCSGAVIVVHGEEITIDSSVTISDTLYTVEGCVNEIFISHIDVYPPEEIQIDTAICQGNSFYGYDSTGVYTFDSINLLTGCNDVVTLNLEVIPTGTENCITATHNPVQSPYKVYPNPVHNTIYIDAENEIESIQLYSSHGRMIDLEEIKISDTRAEIKLPANISDGFYIISFQLAGKVYFDKIVVCGRFD